MNLRLSLRQFPRLRITRLSGAGRHLFPQRVPANLYPQAWCSLCGDSAATCECHERITGAKP